MRYVLTFKEVGENKGTADGLEVIGHVDAASEDPKNLIENTKKVRIGVYQDDGDDWAAYRMYSMKGDIFWDAGIGEGEVHYPYQPAGENVFTLDVPLRHIKLEFDKACQNAALTEEIDGKIDHKAWYSFHELKIF